MDIKDLKSDWTWSGTIPHDTINVYVWYNETGDFIDYVTYTEYYRAFVQLKSLKYGDVELSFSDLYTGAGNETLTLEVYVFDKVVVAGAWWNPTGAVSFSVDDKPLGSVTPNATGFFNVTLDIPELTVGEHTVKVTNADVTYVFTIYVYPTLVLTPEEGYVGDVVEAKVYGFPAEVLVGIWWYGYYGLSNLVNGTTGPDGRFNVTVTFTVPNDYGGEHEVRACYPWDNCDVYAIATFTILPKLVVVPSTFSNDGSEVRVIGTGFAQYTAFTVNIDNQFIGVNNDYYWTTPIWTNGTGNIEIVFIAAGFRPGLHVVALYPEAYEPPYAPAAYALFTVTGEGDPIYDTLQSIGATLEGIVGDLAVIKTDVGTIEMKLEELEPVITSIQGDVATIKTDVGTIKADVSAIKPVITSIQGDVAAIKPTLDVLSMISTAVWLAVAFSLISVLVAVYVVMVIRRKIAG